MLAKVSPNGLPAAPIRNKNRYGNVHFSSQTDLWATPQWVTTSSTRNFISRLMFAPARADDKGVKLRRKGNRK
jgi:hypothetical protein